MNFTKTSPKFGQWSDHRANTVYGLGFSSEKELLEVSTREEEGWPWSCLVQACSSCYVHLCDDVLLCTYKLSEWGGVHGVVGGVVFGEGYVLDNMVGVLFTFCCVLADYD